MPVRKWRKYARHKRDPYAKHKNSHQYWKLNLHIWEIDLNVKVLKCPLLKTCTGYTLLLHEILSNVSSVVNTFEAWRRKNLSSTWWHIVSNVQITTEDNIFLPHNVSLKRMNWHCHFGFSTFWGYRAQLCRHIVIAWETTTETFSTRQSLCMPFAENVFIKSEESPNVWCRDFNTVTFCTVAEIFTLLLSAIKYFGLNCAIQKHFKTFRSKFIPFIHSCSEWMLITCTCTSRLYFWRIVVWPFCHGQKSANKELSLYLFQRSKLLVKTSYWPCLLYLLFIWWHLKLVFVECFSLLYH